jgi:peptide chain release factor subunit 1
VLFAKYNFKILGVIVGGPGPTKENFAKSKNMNYQIKVLGVFDTGYTDEHMGINELLERSKELLAEQVAIQERKVMERFLSEVAHGGLAASGYEKVKAALETGNVIKLILSEDVELTKVDYRCNTCGKEFSRIENGNTRQAKHDCGGNLEIKSQKDAIEELVELADNLGIEVVFINPESQYGKELIMGFGGIAAMLKYRQ